MEEPKKFLSDQKKSIDQKYASPLRLYAITIAGIFIAEVIAMIVIYFSAPQDYWIQTLQDATIMIVLIFPIIYYLSFRPLLSQITERKRSEALLAKVLENLPVGVWITDPNGKFIHGNPATHKLWAGVRYVGIEEYGEYKGWWLDSGKRIEPEEWAAARAISRGETSLNEEIEIECFDGSHKIILNSSVPFFEDGVIQGAIIVNEDITERKRAEEALRLANVYNRSLIEASLDPLVTINVEGKITDVNSATEKVTGCSRIELIGADFFDYFTEPQRAQAGYQQVFLEGSVQDYALEIRHKDGHITPVLYNATVYSDEAGKVIGVFAAARDITERKQYEQALLHSNELIETAFNSVDTLIAYMDQGFNFLRVNEAYATAGGHPVEFFIGKNHFDLYPHEENQAIFQRVVETGEAYSVVEKPFEYSEYPERGMTYWNWSLQPVKGVDGAVQGVVLSLLDVTERKRAKIRLEQQNEELRALSGAEHRQRQLAEGLVKASAALNASLDLGTVLDRIFESIQRTVPFKTADVLLVEDESFSVAQHWGSKESRESDDPLREKFNLDHFPLLQVMARSHQPALVPDVLVEPAWKFVPGAEWIRSYLGTPLIAGEQVIGFINLNSDQPGCFDQEMADRLMAFAAPAAVAVQNARLYTAELRARQVAETLSDVSLALTQTLNLETVMNTLLEYVRHVVPYDQAYIAIAEDGSHLSLRAAHSFESEVNPKLTTSTSFEAADIPYLQEIITTKESLLIRDTRGYTGWKTLITQAEMRNWLGIPMVVGGRAIGVLAMAKTRTDFFSGEHARLAEAIVAQAAVAIQNAWLFEQVRAGHERLQALSRRLVEVQESERRFIARELHDEASQALTALKFGLRLLEEEADHPESLLPRLDELKHLTDGVLEDLHRLAMDLRPASLDHLGLVAALEQLMKVTGERYNLSIRFKSAGILEADRLPDYVETSLYRIVQEALTNAVRHASANDVDVILELRDGSVVVIVEDNGVGFDTGMIGKGGHLGLLGMQERAQMMGGTLQIESRPGGGTTVVT